MVCYEKNLSLRISQESAKENFRKGLDESRVPAYHGLTMTPRRPKPDPLSRRERQIMNAVYRLAEASAADVATELREEDAFDSIRVTLGILEKKGQVRHRREGVRKIYTPVVPLARAKRSALDRLLHTFFDGSSSKAILSLLDSSNLSEQELKAIERTLRGRKNRDLENKEDK